MPKGESLMQAAYEPDASHYARPVINVYLWHVAQLVECVRLLTGRPLVRVQSCQLQVLCGL